MDANDDKVSNNGRREKRSSDHNVAEVDVNECEIRERPTPKSSAMPSEGAEGSLKGRQSRKHLLHDEEYDCELRCERAPRSRTPNLGPDMFRAVEACRHRRTGAQEIADGSGVPLMKTTSIIISIRDIM